MSAADSLHAVATAVMGASTGNPAEVAEFFERWHEFYLLAGTAAVTLVGLLFVSLSFNLDVLLHESKAHLLAHARSTLMVFTYVLIVSLGFLVPFQGLRVLAAMIGAASAVFGTLHVLMSRTPAGLRLDEFERSMRRRGRIFTASYAFAFLTAVGLVVLRAPELSYNMISVICALLGNAMGISWSLLVEVGKLKAGMAKEPAERK